MIFEAIEFAARAHRGQYRKGTKIPYIVHPLGVGKILIDCGASEDSIVAGILHDTIEDTLVTFGEIQEAFGAKVAELVEAASEPDKSASWENRKNHTLERLRILSGEAVLLCLADKLDNIRSVKEGLERHGEDLWRYFRRPREKQEWYYKSLARVFTERLTDEKCRVLLNLFKTEVLRVFP